ncbi:MAG: hypothetical protein IJ272_06375 [Clostridia bacterium]|nr:hypothetical protein [Clostridia bacterium]
MNKIISTLNIRNIQDLYDIQSITENGQINLKDKYVVIYKIDPANIVACDEETKHKIYQAYITCVRGLPDAFQIMVSREKANFDEQIAVYKKRLKEIENEKLKLAIQKYIDYLQEISNVNKLYKTSHYLIVENIQKDEAGEIINMFSNLQEFGVRVSQVKSKEQAENILRKFVMKE